MSHKDQGLISAETFRHPLLASLSRLARRMAGVSLTVICLQPEVEVRGDDDPGKRQGFCRLIRGSAEGAKHCRTCHVLMSVAACAGAPIEHRCHAGACVLVAPASANVHETLAVLSSCLYARQDGWATTRARGAELAVNLSALKQTYLQLPQLTAERLQFGKLIVAVAAEAVKTLREAARLAPAQALRVHESAVRLALGDKIRQLPLALRAGTGKPKGGHAHLLVLVQVVERLITQRPDLPLTVKELAAAARMSPNHFSAIFRRQTGQTFSDYLADKRVDIAKGLLRDLTLNIKEVGERVGYHAPGYFARQFRRHTQLSPSAWRERHLSA